MPPTEQPRSAIFESKPVDLKEWETTLIVILLLLMCLITLTKCVSWNEPCNIHTQGRRSEAPQGERGVKGEERWHSRVMVLRKWRWEGQSFNQVLPLVPPFTEGQSLWKIRTPTCLKKNISWWLAQKGNPYIPWPCVDQLLSFKSARWCLRMYCALGPSRCSLWVILTESLSPYEVVKGSDGKYHLTSGTELAGHEIILCAWERWPKILLRLCSSSKKPCVATWVFL